MNRDGGRHANFDTEFLSGSKLVVSSHHAWFAVLFSCSGAQGLDLRA